MTDNYAFWRSLISREDIYDLFFILTWRKKGISFYENAKRHLSLPSSQNVKWRQFVNIQNNVLGQKIPVFSEKFKIQHPFFVQRSQIHCIRNAEIFISLRWLEKRTSKKLKLLAFFLTDPVYYIFCNKFVS